MNTYDEEGTLHSYNDEPAKTYHNVKEWCCHGKLHRDDNNKSERIVGISHEEYWVHGKRHRDLGPAIIRSNGVDSWYKNGAPSLHTKV